MCFETDLKFADIFERLTIKLYKLKKYERRNDKLYDVKDLETDIKYEVKADKKAHETGNLIIEYECSNKPSGINATEADYYIYYVVDSKTKDYDMYEIPVDKIKSKIKKEKYHKIVSGGDGDRMKGYLFKEKEFAKYLKKSRF